MKEVKSVSVTITAVKNGWKVNKSWEEKNEKNEWDYDCDEWVFVDKQEALNKVTECFS